MSEEFYVKIEAVDEADAYHLKDRILEFLRTCDDGDYQGRLIKIMRERK